MFIPIRTDRRLKYTPWVNYGLIASNVLVYLFTRQDPSVRSFSGYLLNPAIPQLSQFVTYQFLHANLMHLLGNMLFLYVFGNSVEDRLGKFSYLCFYLSGGVLAGLGHALVENSPVIGASGAVAGVSAAYLVLFPKTNVTILYWFIFIGAFEVSSMLLILFHIAQDAVMFMGQYGSVAYLAHLSGYAYGLTIAMGLLWTGLLPREPYDLLSLIEHRRRKAQFASLTQKGYQPWEGAPNTPSTRVNSDQPSDPRQKETMDLRCQIASALSHQELENATNIYTKLIELDATQVMSCSQQLDLANQLMSQKQYETAAHAYELFLNIYKTYTQREQIELILGLIYARYLNRPDRADELLLSAISRLQEGDQKDLARQVLQEISS